MTAKRKADWCTHPGDHLAEYLELHGLSQAAFARKTGLTTKLISTIVARKAPVTARTALRLSRSLKGSISPTMWMALQAQWDLFHANGGKHP